ncbi:ParB/RepB/Spo0J family partition protein [bacterium]|nr:ParB/RepB/Spo0J family partition protein [bacterium]
MLQHIIEIPINKILSNPFQPRLDFNEDKLNELAESIKLHGVLQPVIVTEAGDGYRLIAGERRTRAAALAGLAVVPAIVRSLNSQDMLEWALIENIQRQDLNPIEEAKALSFLSMEFKLTHKEIADRVGRSRSYVTNALRLLSLPEAVKSDLEAGILSCGHARCLLSLDNCRAQLKAWNCIKSKKLSVRETEKYINSLCALKDSIRREKDNNKLDADWQSVIDSLRGSLNVEINLKYRSDGSGKLELCFKNQEELENLIEHFIH